jgi:hypothetical protein
MTATRRSRRRTVLAWAAAVVPLSTIAIAVPAHATPDAGRWRVTATGTGTVTVTCREGTRVFGLGAEVAGGSAHIRELAPNAALTSATVTASASVTTTVHAVCRPPVANMVRVAATGGAGTATATCSAGTTLYGVGVNVHQQNGNVFVTRLTPDLNPPTATVAVNAEVPVTAYAICGAPAGQMNVAEASETVVGSSKTLLVACPAGTSVRSPGAFVVSDTVVLDKVTTNASLTKVKVTAHSAVPGRWVMDAYAVCTAD